MLGMLAYDGDPEVTNEMVASIPKPVRKMVFTMGQRVYAKHAMRVYGTPTP